MPNFFVDNRPALDLRLLEKPNTGFRPGQLGALHSLLAHFSINEDPAVLCLPTGYGKTAILMTVPFILGAKRALVIEPSDALRKQTTSHFSTLSTLRKLQVVPNDLGDPIVIGQKGRPGADDLEKLSKADVVISTPQSTSPAVVPNIPVDLFDVVVFDEAHHAPADTWQAYLDKFTSAKFVFLTATPFRRDRKVIPGKLAYWYPVLRASKEQAFGRVAFRAAQVTNDHDEDEVDRSVASAAIAKLQEDRAAGFDHRLFARASTIKSARNLVPIYTSRGIKVEAIDSHLSKKAQDRIETQLISGELDGVVCVDMFGEGYDFPKLKVAALHAPHKSLVPTLQFIGRFARTNDVSTGDATLVAPLSRLKEATIRLFKEGVDIGQLIDEAAQEAVADTEEGREILEVLKTRKQAESDYDAVSPLLLELYAHTQIFECSARPDFSLIGATIARKLKLAKQWMSDDGLITLLLSVDHSPPNWALSDAISNVRHDAFLLAYNETSKLCFVGSTRRSARIYHDLMQTVCADKYRPVSFEVTRRAIAGLHNLRYYNVGLRNTAINTQAESYRVLTGPRAERAVTTGDGRAFVQGHYFGSGSNGTERETVGASGSSRIWSNRSFTVSEYLAWCSALNVRLFGSQAVEPSQLDIVQHASVLKRIPSPIIAAGWNKVAYRTAPRIRFRNQNGQAWQYGQITDFDMGSFVINTAKTEMSFDVTAGDQNLSFKFSNRGGALFKAGDRSEAEVATTHDDWVEMAQWLSIHPPVFYAADKSSFQGVDVMRPAALVTMSLNAGDGQALDWSGCAIGIEYETSKANGLNTVHQHLQLDLQSRPNLRSLIYDHRSGEAADFIAVTETADADVVVSLYHCKGAGGTPSGTRVGDVYEVAGQLLKSIAYCDPLVLIPHVRHRINPNRHRHPSSFLIGDFNGFEQLLLSTPAHKLKFAIYGVQPGISLSQVDEHLSDLMAFGLDYVRRGGAAEAGWIVSA